MNPIWINVVLDGCFGIPPYGVMDLGRLDGMPVEVVLGPVAEAVLSFDVCVTMEEGSHCEVEVSVPVADSAVGSGGDVAREGPGLDEGMTELDVAPVTGLVAEATDAEPETMDGKDDGPVTDVTDAEPETADGNEDDPVADVPDAVSVADATLDGVAETVASGALDVDGVPVPDERLVVEPTMADGPPVIEVPVADAPVTGLVAEATDAEPETTDGKDDGPVADVTDAEPRLTDGKDDGPVTDVTDAEPETADGNEDDPVADVPDAVSVADATLDGVAETVASGALDVDGVPVPDERLVVEPTMADGPPVVEVPVADGSPPTDVKPDEVEMLSDKVAELEVVVAAPAADVPVEVDNPVVGMAATLDDVSNEINEPDEVAVDVESVIDVATWGAVDAAEDVMPPIDTSVAEETLAVVAKLVAAAGDEVVVPTALSVVNPLPVVDRADETLVGTIGSVVAGKLLPPILPPLVTSGTGVALLTTLERLTDDDVVATVIGPVDVVEIAETIVPVSRSEVAAELLPPLLPPLVASRVDAALLTALTKVGDDDDDVIASVNVVAAAGVVPTAVVVLATLPPVVVDVFSVAEKAVVRPVANVAVPIEVVPTVATNGMPVFRRDEVRLLTRFETRADVVAATVAEPVGVLELLLASSEVMTPLVAGSWMETGRVFDESEAVLVRKRRVVSIVAELLPLATPAPTDWLGDDEVKGMASEVAAPAADTPPVVETMVDVETLPPDTAEVRLESAAPAPEGAVVLDDSVSPGKVRAAGISTVSDEVDGVGRERS